MTVPKPGPPTASSSTLIAHHALTYRNDEGKKDLVRIFFGCIAAVYFFLVLVKHVLGINLPGLGN